MSVKIKISFKELTEAKRMLDSQSFQRVRINSNHGILIIPNVKRILRKSSSDCTVDNWCKFNQCATELSWQKEFQKAKSLSDEMCDLAAQIIHTDYAFCESHPVEHELWHKGVFVVIESLKEKSRLSNEYSKQFFSFLISMRDYYAALISSVQSNYSFSLSVVDNINSIQSETEQKKIMRGALTCHHCYLALGDILVCLLVLRERIPDVGASREYDWATVIGYYQKAQQLSPNNGSTYTQLSVLSYNQQYYLDTVFYSIRSLTAKNPILDVSETLVHLFHNIEKKSTSLQSKSREIYVGSPPKHSNQCDNEVWIIPDNSFKLTIDSEIVQTDKLDFKKAVPVKNIVSPVNIHQLFKDVHLSFLTIQAKLYTNIGTDSVSHWITEFYCSLSAILNNRCNQSLSQIMLKMQLIALFALTNQNTPSKSAQQYKVDFLFSFHFLIIQSMQRNIQCESTVPPHTWYLLPQIRIFVQWMRHNTNLLLDYFQTFSNHRLWSLLYMLANQLISLQLSTEVSTDNNTFLWEDQLLSGCVLTDKFINSRISWETVQLDTENEQSIQYRMSLIISDLRTLSKDPNFPICLDSELTYFSLNTKYTSQTNTNTNIDKTLIPDLTYTDSMENPFEEHSPHSDEEEYLPDDTQVTNELSILRTEKNKLKEQVDKQSSEINKHKQQTIIRHEITPRYIVPDTNCFLSYLHILQQIHTNTSLQLIVPLIVLQELEHLGIPISKSHKHLSSCSKAKDAYSWLMTEFSNPKHKMLALTNQGNLIDTPYTQDFSSVRNQINDDLILQSCVKLNQTWHKPSDPDCIRSCVVLLTSDRNLRLKAVCQNLPAKSIKRFLSLIN